MQCRRDLHPANGEQAGRNAVSLQECANEAFDSPWQAISGPTPSHHAPFVIDPIHTTAITCRVFISIPAFLIRQAPGGESLAQDRQEMSLRGPEMLHHRMTSVSTRIPTSRYMPKCPAKKTNLHSVYWSTHSLQG